MVIEEFAEAQQRVLRRYGVEVESRLVHVPVLDGPAHVLVTGEGPPVMMVIGAGDVAATWAPLMARLVGHRLYAVDMPGHGLSQGMAFSTATLRGSAVSFLSQVLDGLGLHRPSFVSQSMGGLWTTWLAVDEPERVRSISYVACPALILGTSAPFPMRLASVPTLARILSRLDPPSPAQVRRFMRMAGEDPDGLDELVDLFVATGRLPGFDESFGSLLHSAITLRGARPEVALNESDLRRVRQPVQFIWGEDDTFGPPSVCERAAETISDAGFHLVKGGHAPWFHHADAVAAHLVPFLAKHATTAITTGE